VLLLPPRWIFAMPGLRVTLTGSASRCWGRSMAVMGPDPGTYRIVNRIDEEHHVVHVLDIDHRSEIYHRPQHG
jgi:hypothetical protein